MWEIYSTHSVPPKVDRHSSLSTVDFGTSVSNSLSSCFDPDSSASSLLTAPWVPVEFKDRTLCSSLIRAWREDTKNRGVGLNGLYWLYKCNLAETLHTQSMTPCRRTWTVLRLIAPKVFCQVVLLSPCQRHSRQAPAAYLLLIAPWFFGYDWYH